MAKKTEIPEVIVTDGKELDSLIADYLEAKAKKDEADAEMTRLLRVFEKIAGSTDPEEPREGSVDLKGGVKTLRVKFKMTKSIDKDKAVGLCEEFGYNILDVFNVRPEYPTQKILERMNYWNEEDRNKALSIIESATTTKRAKSSVEIK